MPERQLGREKAGRSARKAWPIDRNFALLLKNPDTDGYRQGRRTDTECQRHR